MSSRTASVVYRVSPEGNATEFLELANGIGVATGPDGSIWVGALDTLFHFDAVGRPLEKIATMETHG